MQEWWQHIPEHLDPIVFTVGFLSVHWYALGWLAGFGSALVGALWYRKRWCPEMSREDVLDLFLALFFGAFLGGRLGYGLLYRPDIFLANPVGFFLPFDITNGMWTGISGMSFYGGLIGVVVVVLAFVRKRNLPFFLVTDLVSIVAPLAIFFGRIGNFLAVELYGRVITLPIGMYFPNVSGGYILRHPSTLYEALGEGLVLFCFLLVVRMTQSSLGYVTAWFLVGYGVVRFVVEFFREPDQGMALVYAVFTRGQLFSGLLIMSGAVLLVWLGRKKHGIV